MHIMEAIREMKWVKAHPILYPNAGFLFIDLQQAFDSVDHRILMKKLDQFPGCTP